MAALPSPTRVHLTSTYLGRVAESDWNLGPLRVLQRGRARLPEHYSLVADPAEADWILFADRGPEPYFGEVLRSAIYRAFRDRVFVHCQDDRPLALLPGVYTSIERAWMDRGWAVSGCYLHDQNAQRFGYEEFLSDAPWLFSFVGSAKNAVVRREILKLHHPRGLLIDSSGEVIPAFESGIEPAVAALIARYRSATRQSRFVLCPRGVGCATMRLFEVMEMGRAPIVISDDWVEPEGPEWGRFSVRVAESDVASIPERLERIESEAEAMGRAARLEWERWFSPDAALTTIVRAIDTIRQRGHSASSWRRASKRLQFLRPFHLRNRARRWRSSFPIHGAGRVPFL